MIPLSRQQVEPQSWQQELSRAITDPAELLRLLRLPGLLPGQAQSAHQQFPLKVTRHYLSLISPANPDDPLLRQILPLAAEMQHHADFIDDPVGDREASVHSGMIHKYAGRALLIASPACAIHCRYCFRRNYPYESGSLRNTDNEQVFSVLDSDTGIQEVILSGGDPLSLSDERLAALIKRLESIRHINILRIHTRLPVVLPQRVTDALLEILQDCRLQVVMVLHINHAREVSPSLARQCNRLAASGITLLNQSVLLRGVNDDCGTLETLSHSLFKAGILPYYLHQLDRVRGAVHFEVVPDVAKSIYEKLQQRLPGYLVPRLVREQQHRKNKQIIGNVLV